MGWIGKTGVLVAKMFAVVGGWACVCVCLSVAPLSGKQKLFATADYLTADFFQGVYGAAWDSRQHGCYGSSTFITAR